MTRTKKQDVYVNLIRDFHMQYRKKCNHVTCSYKFAYKIILHIGTTKSFPLLFIIIYLFLLRKKKKCNKIL